jgi:predicted SAM-dependent methyltransferase
MISKSSSDTDLICLNLGCGNRFHPKWINIDIEPAAPEVIRHNLAEGIPLADASCDVVYHAHVLEHIRRDEAISFIRECRRVLKPGGVLRIATPDLERIIELYQITLRKALEGDDSDYEWIMLELFDQTIREKTGGRMGEYLKQANIKNERFVLERIGEESGLRRCTSPNQTSRNNIFHRALSALKSPNRTLRKIILPLLPAKTRKAFEIGYFRLQGEVHQWMYDRYSLAKLLRQAEFANPVVQSAASSLIPFWADFHLDMLPDGTIIKPDSIYMEAARTN